MYRITYQRTQCKVNKLEKVKITLLNNIGFDFNYTPIDCRYYEEKFSHHVLKHGNDPPSDTTDPEQLKIPKLLTTQSWEIDSGKISEERLSSLNQIVSQIKGEDEKEKAYCFKQYMVELRKRENEMRPDTL